MYSYFRFLLCVSFICVIYAKSRSDIKAWFVRQGLECNKDHPVTPDEIKMLHKHKMPDSNNARCLMACVYKKSKWLNDKGIFDVDGATITVEDLDDLTEKEKTKKIFDICKKVNDETVSDDSKGCERAELLFKCITENAEKMGIKPT